MSETSHQVLCMYPTSHPCRACATSHLNTDIDYSLEHCHNSNHIPRTNYLLGLKGNFFYPVYKLNLRTSLEAQCVRIGCQCRGHTFNPWFG